MNVNTFKSIALVRGAQMRAARQSLCPGSFSLIATCGLVLALSAALSIAPHARAQSPVAHYKFTTSDAVTTDASGNNNTLTLNKGAAFNSSGQSGGCLLLDGVNDYAEASNSSSLNITGNAITVMSWVRFDVIDSTAEIILAKVKSAAQHSDPYFSYSLQRMNTGELRFWVTVGGVGKWVKAGSPVANTWYHVAGTYDGSQVKLYIDGVLSGTPTSATGNITGYTTPLRLGVNGNLAQRLDGRLDDVRIYNVALTQTQIQAIGSPPPAVPSALTASAFSTSKINLAWTDNSSNETGFKIRRKTGSGGTYAQVATVGANVTSYNDTMLIADTTYYYVVRAYNAAGDSVNSNEASATTLFNNPPPPPDVTFNSGNPYTAAKVDNEPAGTVFRFSATGNGSGGGTYTNVTIPTKNGNKYTFAGGTLLDGANSADVAFATGDATDVEIYDCAFTRYLGVDSAGIPDKKNAGAIRMGANWKLYRPHGFNNKYAAVRFRGPGGLIAGGRLNNNGQYGFNGTSDNGEIRDCEVDGNGSGAGLVDVGNDRGGCKIVESDGFKFIRVHAHNNAWNGLWTDINNINILYDDCDVHDNMGAGIQHEISFAAEIRNNRVSDNWREHHSDLHPSKAQIQIMISPDVWVHNNTVSGGYYGITAGNQNHPRWLKGGATNGCLGVRNLLVENNTITMYDDGQNKWIAVAALTGNLPADADRTADQRCGQKDIIDPASNNIFRNNTVNKSGGKYPSTPYIFDETFVSGAFWASKGFD